MNQFPLSLPVADTPPPPSAVPSVGVGGSAVAGLPDWQPPIVLRPGRMGWWRGPVWGGLLGGPLMWSLMTAAPGGAAGRVAPGDPPGAERVVAAPPGAGPQLPGTETPPASATDCEGGGPAGKTPEFQPPVYQIAKTGQPVQIDGQLTEPAWFAAPAIDHFEFTWHKSGAREQSVAKLLYDDEFLYVGHVCQDAHITARHTEHDGPIPEDDCFEVIFAPDPAHPEVYFNIEWNVRGGYVDNHRPEGPNKPRAKVWDAEGVQIAGRYLGTLNDDTDRDESWTCEVAIPLKNFARFMPALPPKPGSHWNLNLNRHGGQTNPQYSQWSRADTATPSFHTPHRFGRGVFSGRTVPFEAAE